jgi:acyl-coenzyme A synthetase/AMP-(fatty) acid ligase
MPMTASGKIAKNSLAKIAEEISNNLEIASAKTTTLGV